MNDIEVEKISDSEELIKQKEEVEVENNSIDGNF